MDYLQNKGDYISFAICAVLSFGAIFLHEILGTLKMLPPLTSTELEEEEVKGLYIALRYDMAY